MGSKMNDDFNDNLAKCLLCSGLIPINPSTNMFVRHLKEHHYVTTSQRFVMCASFLSEQEKKSFIKDHSSSASSAISALKVEVVELESENYENIPTRLPLPVQITPVVDDLSNVANNVIQPAGDYVNPQSKANKATSLGTRKIKERFITNFYEKEIIKCILCGEIFYSQKALEDHSRLIHNGNIRYSIKRRLHEELGNDTVDNLESLDPLETSTPNQPKRARGSSVIPQRFNLLREECTNNDEFTLSSSEVGPCQSDLLSNYVDCNIRDMRTNNISEEWENSGINSFRFPCDFCDTSFTQKRNLSRHMQNSHGHLNVSHRSKSQIQQKVSRQPKASIMPNPEYFKYKTHMYLIFREDQRCRFTEVDPALPVGWKYYFCHKSKKYRYLCPEETFVFKSKIGVYKYMEGLPDKYTQEDLQRFKATLSQHMQWEATKGH